MDVNEELKFLGKFKKKFGGRGFVKIQNLGGRGRGGRVGGGGGGGGSGWM